MSDTTEIQRESQGQSVVRVALPVFTGPLDLLLHLIQRDEIEIRDIPIAKIAREYLDTLELMRELDLEVAGEFLVMAATLMRIKARMLLPPAIMDEEEEDPREGLVRQLLEYRRFKEAARDLERLEGERRHLFDRGAPAQLEDPADGELQPVSLFRPSRSRWRRRSRSSGPRWDRADARSSRRCWCISRPGSRRSPRSWVSWNC